MPTRAVGTILLRLPFLPWVEGVVAATAQQPPLVVLAGEGTELLAPPALGEVARQARDSLVVQALLLRFMAAAVAAVRVKWGTMLLTVKAAMVAMAWHPLLRVRQPTTRVAAAAWSKVAQELAWGVLGEEVAAQVLLPAKSLVSLILAEEAEGIGPYHLTPTAAPAFA
jgi:hypothetical protein